MSDPDFKARLTSRLRASGVDAPSEVIARVETYYQLLATWNKRLNLTAFNLDQLSPEAIDRLFVEPILAAQHVPSGGLVLDVGSGGGSPAIPFALAAQAARLTMVESRARKSVFLKEAARAVSLPGTVVTNRFESAAATSDMAEKFDLVTVRAVRIDDEDWRRVRGVLKANGSFLLLHQPGASVPLPDGFIGGGVFLLTERAQLSIFARQ